jgi:DNA-directed RNA polymerase specialized sigma24 family protein
MSSRESGPEWVLSAFLQNTEARGQDDVSELAIVARRLWPRVQAHARKELTNKTCDDAMALATDVWESVLRSVAKTMCRSNGKGRPILNLEAYLFGAFHHRFNRSLRRERRRREIVEYLPLGRDLERLRQAHDSKAVADLDRSIQVKQTIENMDNWTRTVWMARQSGYSWREIAEYLRLTEPQAKLRFRYALGRLRARFGSAA